MWATLRSCASSTTAKSKTTILFFEIAVASVLKSAACVINLRAFNPARTRSKMDHNTVFGRFRVDRDGVQIGNKMLLLQWQDGKRVIVWPEELAPGRARFPTPPWSQRP